ncbi:DNA translocase FtsK [Liquorilactobacillus oeni]|uniref:DNA translocase FtsK n=1 Tax=Liquorilactobacillus oeni DSM 19972 TaxID=1423777 RepID=A0A0R1M9D5_9LACO|nr:DNA translocase FtsK [Liquorilactobacillus oeni]KRL04784.1 cell division protein [Liquorilactobacillus oeni DSM 19972]
MAQRKRKRRSSKRKEQFGSKRLAGGFIVFCALLGLFKLGYLGILCLNLFRVIMGDAAAIGLVFLGLEGVFLLVTGKERYFKRNVILGSGGIVLGILLFLHAFYFNKLDLHSDFIGITWQYLRSDLVTGGIGGSVGGGLIGACLYSLSYFLFSQIGTYIVAGFGIVFSLCVLLGVSFERLLKYCGDALSKCLLLSKSLGTFLGKVFKMWLAQTKIKLQKMHKNKETVGNKTEQKKQHQETVPFEEETKEDENKDIESEPVSTNSWNTTAAPAEKPLSSSNSQQDEQGVFEANSKINDHYQLPPSDLLHNVEPEDQSEDYKSIEHNTKVLKQTFQSFGVDVEIKHAILGPAVTKYELHPAIGVKVSKIVNLSDDLALALAAKDIRIEAPIPGKSLIGIEVPNQKVSTVSFRSIIEEQRKQPRKPLEVPLGRDIAGKLVTADLGKMPHLLIAGSTGSGKSVAINGIITSLLMNCPPHLVKLMLVDPKKVELGVYNGIPHLLTPVVTNPKKASKALHKLVSEMERRYELFANTGQRNVAGYNEMIERQNQEMKTAEPLLPYIVIIVDELSDLMMVASNEVEDAIIRLAQMARAAGIHMILATQRPSVDVITGLIKANVPSRMAFAVSSGTDSRTILDTNGAEKLLGRGDMLFLPMGMNKPIRVQGAFVSDGDVAKIVSFVKEQQPAEYDESLVVSDEETERENTDDSEDELFADAVKLIGKEQSCSISMLQRRFRIGYNRAARLVDELEAKGMVGPSEGSKPRKVYLSNSEGEDN